MRGVGADPRSSRRERSESGEGWGEVLEICLTEARRMLRDGAMAEEAAQEAVLRAWRHGRAVDPHKRRAWLTVVTRNEARRCLERQGRRRQREVLAFHGAPGDEQHAATSPASRPDATVPARVGVRQALRRLPAGDRKLLFLHYSADMPLPEIAEELVMPLGTVKARVHRARARLRKELTS